MSARDKVNILLVDDQPGKLLSYQAMLSELGENLITASSAREALDLLLKNDITIVLMDVSMPEFDGFELAEMIRQHPRYQKTAIIFVSAVNVTDMDRLKGYESGAVDYVSVPVVPELLRAKVSVFAELYRKTRESERLNRELEQRVAERTAELEAAVRKQIEMGEQLREADRRKDEFLATLAHELRNPLAPVRNAAAVLRLKGTNDADLLWCHDVIERQTRHLSRLVDDLLDVSRITQGKIRLRLENVDLGSIVTGAVETSQPIIDAHRHELVVSLPERPVAVSGDRERLTQVVANLLNNAAKYQNEQGRIELSARREGGDAVIVVRDRGIGISAQMLPRVFDLFSQEERASDHSQGGLGVGLSLVKKLVELHGGTVRAESTGIGQGSAFVLRLPCLAEDRRPDGDDTAIAAPRAGGSPARILVVDDNRDSAESLAILLRLRGHEVSVAHDGPKALELAARERPDILLVDIGLPGMDGYEVCRRVRAMGLTEARMIALTGFGQERDRLRAQAAGFDHHAVKPVAMPELTRMLQGA
jgi:signal transduction histidine kinase